MEHEEQADKLEQELQRLEEHSDEVGEQIEEARRDWESKEDDPTVPGAQPDPSHDESEDNTVTETPERSDQLPEEGPAEQVPDDTGASEAHDPPGVPGEEGTATGNPDAAGADEEDPTAD